MIGMPVRKSGATTGVTQGNITSIHGTYSNLTDVLQIEGPLGSTFANYGDSGSVIVDNDNKIVGLLWGGGQGNTANYGFATAIGPVLAALGLYVPGDPRPRIDPGIASK
jgi:hypothetical protein